MVLVKDEWKIDKKNGRGDIGEVLGMELEKDRERVLIIMVYMEKKRKRNLELMNRRIEEVKDSKIILSGDFNARTGERGGWDEEERKRKRNSRDKTKNQEERKLIDGIEESGLEIRNGNIRVDEFETISIWVQEDIQ